MNELKRISGLICNLKQRNISYVENAKLKDYTTVGIGGKVGVVVEPNSHWQICQTLGLAKKWCLKTVIIGGGSNIVGVDEDNNWVVVRIGREFSQILCENEKITVEAGASLNKIQKFSLTRNLSGLESFVGIPATIGGLITMNGGAFAKSVSDVVENVRVLDNGEIKTILKEDCDFDYRHSRFLNSNEVILDVTLNMRKGESSEIIKKTCSCMAMRRKKQPHNVKTFGSVFKNPEGDFAGRLIESVGLKGFIQGDCRFSPIHGNFIENLGEGNRGDINKLIDTAQEKVYNIYKIKLQQEVRFL